MMYKNALIAIQCTLLLVFTFGCCAPVTGTPHNTQMPINDTTGIAGIQKPSASSVTTQTPEKTVISQISAQPDRTTQTEEKTAPTPSPLDLSGTIDRFYNLGNEVSWFTAHSISARHGTHRVSLTEIQTKALLDLLKKESIYFLGDMPERKRTLKGLEIRAYFGGAQDQMILQPQEDGSVSVAFSWSTIYTTDNPALFTALLKLAGISELHIETIGNIKSITLRSKNSHASIHTDTIRDATTIKQITDMLKAFNAGASRENFEPDAEIVLHTVDGSDIICSFYAIPRENEPDNEVVINDFYWYESQELINYIREMAFYA